MGHFVTLPFTVTSEFRGTVGWYQSVAGAF